MSDERKILTLSVEASHPILECDLCSSKQEWDIEYRPEGGSGTVYLASCDAHLGRILAHEVRDVLGGEE